ncbi:MAG TPA: PilN domain-containing protein [Clostridia bacterium]|nr:PilN domain-containing protein [Clostridia bacterium]
MRDINLIPEEYLKKKSRPKVFALGAVIAVLTAALLVYLYIVPLTAIKNLEQDIKEYDEIILDYNILKNKIDKMQESEELIQKKLEVLGRISAGEIKPTKVFEMVLSSLPADVWLTELSYTFTDVSLTAVAESASGATEFYIELSKKDGFEDIRLSTITVDGDGYNFTIQFSLSTGSEEDNENKAK